MGIKMTTPMSDIDAFLNSELERIYRLTVRMLCLLGEKCVIEARTNGQYTDQTGNLRSSIGYVVVYNGGIVDGSSFNTVAQGSDGSTQGRELAEKLAKNYKKGYALIVVAGMNYASYVEAIENKSVLISAELFARRELPSMIEKLRACFENIII